MNANGLVLAPACAFAALALLGAPSALAENYSYTQLDVPGASYTVANVVSTSGTVAGIYGLGGVDYGFVWSAGTFTQLNVVISHGKATPRGFVGISDKGLLAGFGAVAQRHIKPLGFTYNLTSGATKRVKISDGLGPVPAGLNNKNALVGSFETSNELSQQGFLIQGGTTTVLSVPGSTTTNASAINDSGAIAGIYTNGSSDALDFTYQNGTYTTWQPPGATSSFISGIDSAGDISGNVMVSNGVYRGFVKIRNKFTALRYPGARTTETVAPVSSGQIVGNYGSEPNDLFTNAFNYVGGTFYNLVPPGAIDVQARGVNGSGTIVGSFDQGGAGYQHGFVATCAGGAGGCTN